MDTSQKYLNNTFPEFSQENSTHQLTSLEASLQTDFEEKFKKYCSVKPETLTQAQDCLGNKHKYFFIYTGTGGYALPFWKAGLYFKSQGDLKEAEQNFKKAALSLKENLTLMRQSKAMPSPAFFLSECGLLTLQFLVFKELQRDEEAAEALSSLLKNVDTSSKLEDINELLYGRAGYLYCLLLLKKYHPEAKVEKEVGTVLQELYNIGTDQGETEILRFSFYKTACLGAAHGLAGIYYVMLEALKLQSEEFKIEEKIKKSLQASCEKIMGLQEEDGNLKFDLDSDKTDLVFWCHGAPGFIAMLCAAYERYKDEKYLASAELAGECTWKRGILKKGNCLCHGVSGNAYCLMTLYRKTKNLKWKYRALSFGSILRNPEFQNIFSQVEDPARKKKGIADFPLSLMEGLAGEICMYADFMNKEEKHCLFPGYEIS